ncbi:SLC13 family permease [Elioraea rosea]|uniref:SLC13 family permease n=1 Tax=Elioraea rosea TaxID=2492390 RepID=UPI00118447F2|nr:SLC13 family permease [Elioraea rosea]
MTPGQIAIAAIIAVSVAMFIWGRWRHDMVALGALIASVAAGVVDGENAFVGFGHPAVITVACVLVLSRGLQNSGAVDALALKVMPKNAGETASIGILTAVATALSAFMNNVGALAMVMPLALQLAKRKQMPPGRILMPLAFGTVLGGIVTLIGTPPNLIVSAFRAQAAGAPYGMFEFAPVGLPVAVIGTLFIVLTARFLVPVRPEAGFGGFDTAAYVTEAKVPEGAKAIGMTLADVDKALETANAQVLGIVRHNVRMRVPYRTTDIREGDILQVEADPDALSALLAELGLVLEEAVKTESAKPTEGEETATASDGPVLIELVVLPGARIAGRSPTDIALRSRFGLNLLALSRQGRRSTGRLREERLRAGDVLLMQGDADTILAFAGEYGCAPLAERPLRLPDKRQIILSIGLLAGAVIATVFGVPAAVAFAAAMLGAMATNVVPPRSVYTAIDWPVIVLLGALMPVADAVETTGLAEVIASSVIGTVAGDNAVIAILVILVVTMMLSDVVNNAATAAVMCPIAISTAQAFGASADPFLMAVAIGASCAFLTPIGHQNNTLILGPGGFRFGDYWPLGLPLEIVVVVVAMPLLLFFWPL